MGNEICTMCIDQRNEMRNLISKKRSNTADSPSISDTDQPKQVKIHLFVFFKQKLISRLSDAFTVVKYKIISSEVCAPFEPLYPSPEVHLFAEDTTDGKVSLLLVLLACLNDVKRKKRYER